MSIGGKTMDEALAALSDMTGGMNAIGKDEHLQRIASAQAFMREQGIAAMYLNAGTNMSYFTGTKWHASERMVGAILPATARSNTSRPRSRNAPAATSCWSKARSTAGKNTRARTSCSSTCWHAWASRQTPPAPPRIGICESAPFFIADGMRPLARRLHAGKRQRVTAYCRARKSAPKSR